MKQSIKKERKREAHVWAEINKVFANATREDSQWEFDMELKTIKGNLEVAMEKPTYKEVIKHINQTHGNVTAAIMFKGNSTKR